MDDILREVSAEALKAQWAEDGCSHESCLSFGDALRAAHHSMRQSLGYGPLPPLEYGVRLLDGKDLADDMTARACVVAACAMATVKRPEWARGWLRAMEEHDDDNYSVRRGILRDALLSFPIDEFGSQLIDHWLGFSEFHGLRSPAGPPDVNAFMGDYSDAAMVAALRKPGWARALCDATRAESNLFDDVISALLSTRPPKPQ